MLLWTLACRPGFILWKRACGHYHSESGVIKCAYRNQEAKSTSGGLRGPYHYRLGKDPLTALTAQLRREHLLKGEALGMALPEVGLEAKPVVVAAPAPVGNPLLLDTAMAAFLAEAEQRCGKRTVAVYRLCLSLFRTSCEKERVCEIGRDDILRFITYLRSRGSGARTVSNRVCSLRAFLRDRGLTDIVRTKDIPRFTEKLVDAYGPEELRSLLRVCTPEQSLLYRFFLASGAREQEIAFATYRDLDFEAKLFHVRAKEDLGWTLKDYKERSVPLSDSMLQELVERRASPS